MIPTLQHIPRFLRSLRARQKGVWVLSALLVAVTLALLVYAGVLVAEAIAWFDPATRTPLANTLTGVLLLLAVGFAGFTLRQFLLRNTPGDDRLAHVVWDRDEDIRDRVLDALDLANNPDPNSSEALRAAALSQSDRLADGLDPRPFVDRNPLVQTTRVALVVLGVLIVTFAIGRGNLLDAATRIANPGARYIKPGTTFLTMDAPDSLRIIQGDTLRIATLAEHTRPRFVDLILDEGAGTEQIVRMSPDPADTMRFVAAVPGLKRDVTLWARSGRKTGSDSVQVHVTRRPRIARLNVTVQPPRYTGLDPVNLPEGVGDLTALPGSRVAVTMNASRPLANANLLLQPSYRDTPDTFALELAGREATGAFRLRSEGTWWLEFMATDSIAADDPIVWALGTAEDLNPRVQIHSPDDGALIPEALVVPLAVSADDDYGISRMRLRYRIHTEVFDADSVSEDEYAGYDLPMEQVAPGQAIVAMRWSLYDLPLLPTDEVHYFVEVWDNDTWSGPKRVRSELRRLVFPSVEELYAITDEQEENAGDELAKAYEQAERTRQKLEETLTRLKSNPEEMSWDEARALQQTLDEQEQALQQMQNVAESLEQMRQQASEHNLMSEELLEKYKQMQELLEEIATPEMREAMEKMREAMENLDGEQMREALEELLQNQEQLLENIDRNLAILEQLKMERQLDELATRAEDLAERQEQLSEQLDTAAPEEMDRLAQEQESIEEQAEQLAEDVEQAGEEMAEMNEETADSLSQISEEMQSEAFQQPMQQSAGSMMDGQRQEAKKSSKEAEENMKKMAMRLRMQQQQMVAQNKQDLADEMSRVFDAILIISRHQEELREQSRTLGVASPRYRELAADQEGLITGMGAVDRAVGELMKKSFFVGAKIAGNLTRARAFMQEAIQRYTDRRPQDVMGSQSSALAFLHRSLHQLNQSQQSMMASGSGTGYQEMMQQLKQMAQQQQQINQSSGGQMPMPMPGGTQPGGMSLSQAAAQQRALAEQMQSLESGSQSMEDILGSLDGMAGDMQEVADDLEDRNVTERTRRLQQRILQRLLDSQRSLQEREHSKQRQGELAEDIFRSGPGGMPVETEDQLRERLLKALEGDYARVWRETIRQYYRALERDRQADQPTTPPAGSSEQ
ncbi:hypothetical protein KQI52_15425 [bacterium]|nr:hypothetical protein [bacterium]